MCLSRSGSGQAAKAVPGSPLLMLDMLVMCCAEKQRQQSNSHASCSGQQQQQQQGTASQAGGGAQRDLASSSSVTGRVPQRYGPMEGVSGDLISTHA